MGKSNQMNFLEPYYRGGQYVICKQVNNLPTIISILADASYQQHDKKCIDNQQGKQVLQENTVLSNKFRSEKQ